MPLGKTWSDFIIATSGSRGRKMNEKRGGERDFPLRQLAFQTVSALMFMVLMAALVRVTAIQGSYFRQLADGNRLSKHEIPAPRGIIYDRNEVALTANVPAYRLSECDKDGKCHGAIISKDQAIDLQSRGLPQGQDLVIDSARSYPLSDSAAHLLGYVSEVTAAELSTNKNYSPGDMTGRGGVEEKYDGRLAGQKGKEIFEVDALGRKLRTLAKVPAEPGEKLRLSIDGGLQEAAYKEIKSVIGAVVVSDPGTGEILALASSPAFDPNVFTDPTLSNSERTARINSLFSDKRQPLFDRAISGTYPSGSTFKIMMAVAGLESGKITPQTEITDPGILIIGPYKFPNWLYLRNGGTQGVLNVVSALKVSNDIFFYKTGEGLGVDGIAAWAGKFGLGRPLGVDLPGEAGGVVPTKEWRDRNTASWYLGDTYHLAIGQGDLLVTPLQVNAWTAVIANGGKLCQPRVLRIGQWEVGNGSFDFAQGKQSAMGNELCRDLGISAKTIALVREGMIEACSPGGTAWPLFGFGVKGSGSGETRKIQVACKTGTAEFGDPNDRTHAWLTAYAPAEKPTIAVTVLVEGGGEGSDVAAPIVKKVLEKWFSK